MTTFPMLVIARRVQNLKVEKLEKTVAAPEFRGLPHAFVP